VKNAAVLCENHREESRKFELARLRKKNRRRRREEEEEEEEEETFWPSGDFLVRRFRMLFSATGCAYRHKSTRR